MLTNDTFTDDSQAEQQAEAARRAAFQDLLHWKGRPLKWGPSRAGLYEYLRVPPPLLSAGTLAALKAAKDAEGTADEAALNERANELYVLDSGGQSATLRNASILLWLAAHDRAAWRGKAHDRAALLEEIEDWIDENVSMAEVAAVSAITNQLLEQAESTRAIPRPRPAGDEAGN